MKVHLLLVDGFTDSGLAVVLDVLRAANRVAGPTFEIELFSAHGGAVVSASRLVTASTKRVRSAKRGELMLALGLWVESAAAVDEALRRLELGPLLRALQRSYAQGATVGASCAGVFLLAAAGLLERRRATTTWWLAAHLANLYPRVSVEARAALVTDGRLLTSGAVFGVANLALHVVARALGPTVAQRCANLLLLDRHPSQAPYMAAQQLSTDDPALQRAEAWARAHLADGFTIDTLARRAGTSPRTLARKLAAATGQSPLAFVQRIRLETAVYLLRTTGRSVGQISREVGYADANNLRRLMRRELSGSPGTLRGR